MMSTVGDAGVCLLVIGWRQRAVGWRVQAFGLGDLVCRASLDKQNLVFGCRCLHKRSKDLLLLVTETSSV